LDASVLVAGNASYMKTGSRPPPVVKDVKGTDCRR